MIGNCIGANNIPLAKKFLQLTSKFASAMVLVLSTITLLANRHIATFFTNEEEVIEMSIPIIMLAAVFNIFNGA